MADKYISFKITVNKKYSDKTIQIKFFNGETFNIPADTIICHHALNANQPAINRPIDIALDESAKYFQEHPDQLAEYATNAMGWIDVLLVAKPVNKLNLKEKIEVWAEAEKTLLEVIE